MTARAAVLLALLVGGCGGGDDEIVVFAAASLTDVAEAAAARVERETGRSVVVSVGASSDLARQIVRGAPADVFLSADPAWIRHVRDRTDAVREVQELARGRLVVVGPRGTPGASSVEEALGGAGRIAVGDPAHVPAGVYARRALQRTGTWERVEGRLVPQADVRAALAAVESGAVERAVVYASDAVVADRVGVVYPFDEAATGDIVYEAVLLGSERGRPVLDALTDREGRASFRRFGFEPLDP